MANIKTTASTKSLLSVTQAAKILKVSPDTLRNWEKSGKLIPERTPGGARRYQLSTLNELKKELNPVQKKKGMLSISKAAKELGVSSDTLRNWEKKGLIQTDRTDGGARRYSKAQLTELKAELGLDDRKKKVSDRNTAEFIPTELNNPQIPAQAQIYKPIINSEINNTTGHEAKKIVLGTVFSTFRLAIPLFLMLLVFIPLLVFGLSSEPKTDSVKQGDYDKKIYDLASSVESLQNTLFSLTSEASDSAKFISEQNVLAVSTIANLGKYIEVNADTSIAGNLAVDGEAIFGENITAPNIVYGLIAGTNVTITGDPQNPVISSTGATEVDTLATVTARGATTTAPVTLAGGVTISNVLTLGQLGSDPTTGSNGGIYYNTSSNKYRCYINGSWGDCDTDTDTVQEAIGDITSVTLGNGLNGGGTTGDITVNLEIPTTGATTTTGSNSGLELTADGLSLVRGCINNQSLIWDSTLEQWKCGALNAVITIQEGDADVSTNASVVDFLGADFAVNESPSSEVNVSIDYANSHITRDNQTQSISGAWTMGDLTISDANVTLSGASTTFTQTTGAISFVPAAGSNFDISLSGTGDFAVNGNHLYVDTSTGYVGIGDNSPTAQLTIGSGDLFQVTAAGNVVFNQTSPSIAIGNTGVLTITDGTNTLLSLSDNGTAGTLNINTLTASVISGHTLAGNVVGSGSPTLSGLGTINGATISGGTISGGTLSGGTYTATGSTVAGNHTATIGDGGSFNVSDGTNLIFTVSDSGTVGNLTNIGTISTTGAITQAGQTLDNTYVNVAENPTAADIGGSFQAGLTINADSVALGTDTTGDYVANVTAGSGLTGSVTGEGSTPTLAVGTGNGITVNADDVAVDQSFNFIFTGNVSFTPSGTGDVTVSIDADSSFILDNIQSGTPASSLCVDSNDVVITCTVSGSGDITAVGDVTSGDAFTNGGSGNSLYFNNNANTGQLTATTLTGTRTYTLPDASGTVCLSSGNCSASGVTSLNGLTGALTIANATGVGSTITIDDATTAAKGIASFSSSNFAVSSGAVSIKSGGVGTTEIADGSVANGDLANSSVTINTAGPLGGGGAVSLGGTLNLTCATCLTTSTTLFTLSATSGSDSTISSGDTVTLTAGTGITTTNDGAGEITIANSGVLSNVAGTGISVSGATGNVTITNTGVTSLAGTVNQISVSGATGSVTLSLPQDIATTSGVTFATVNTGQGAYELYAMDQNVLTTSNVTFENIIGNGSITLGSDSADTVTVNGIVQGASPFVLEGSTADGFETTFALTDPTADRTITFQNNDGVVPVATAGNTIFFTTSGDTNLTLPTSGTVCTTATCVTSAVTSATGTANQVLVNGTSGSAQTGAVTFTTPQDIGTSSSVTFGGLTLTPAAAGAVTLNQYGTGAGETAELRFKEGGASSTQYVGFKAPDSLTSNAVYILPNHDTSAPSGDYVLTWQSGNILQWKAGSGVGGVGDITDVTAGTGLTGGGASGAVTLNIGAGDGINVDADDIDVKLLASPINGASTTVNSASGMEFVSSGSLSLIQGCADTEVLAWDEANDYWECAAVSGLSGVGDITDVTAGAGLTGGGSSGAVSLAIGSSSTITVNADDIAVTADSIGDTQLAFNTGQHLTTTSNVTFADVTTNGNTIIGSDNGDALTVNAVIQGGSPFIFEGASADGFETTFALTDPTADRTQTFQNNDGVIALGTAGNTIFFTTTDATDVTLPTSGTLCSTSTCEDAITFSNGLTRTVDAVTWGGPLTGNTTITQDGTETLTFSNTGTGEMTFDLTSTGVMNIKDNGVSYWTFDDDSTVDVLFPAAGSMTIDAATTDSTLTTGVIDLNIDTITNNNLGFNIDYIIRDSAGITGTAARINATIDTDAAESSVGYGLYINGANDDASSTLTALFVDAGTGVGTEYAAVFTNGNVGIGDDTTPDVTFEIEDNVSEQMRLGYDNTNYASFGISATGDLTLNATGSQILFGDGDVFNIGGVTGLGYNAISDSGTTGHGLASDDDLYIEGDLEVDGSSWFDGAVTLGDATGDTITFTGYIGSSLIPSANDTYDLGSDANRWKDLYLGGETLHIGTSTTDEGVLSYTTAGNALLLDNAGTSGSINFGNGTTNPTYLFNGSGTFGTSTGAVSLNGDTTVANTKNFVAGQTTGKIGFGGAVSGSDYLMNITLDNTQDWARGINITQANDANESSSVINIANTSAPGSVTTTRDIKNISSSISNSFSTGDGGILNLYGNEQTINIGTSNLTGDATSTNRLFTYGNYSSISGTARYNLPSGTSGTPQVSIYGTYSSVSPLVNTIDLNIISGITEVAAGYFINTAGSSSSTNQTYDSYGIKASSSNNLGTAGATAHYGGLFQSSGQADNNYGLHATTSSGADNSYAGFFNVTGNGTNNYGLYATTTATATNNYGLYIDSVSASASNYSIYSNAAAQSYFAGNVGIGDSSPAALFTVGDGDDFQINSTGAIIAATGISSSGTIAFSGLSTDGVVYTTGGTGTLASEANLAVARGGTNTNSIGSAGSVAYSTGTAYAFTAVGNSNECLVSNGSSAPSWTSCTNASNSPFESNAGVITKVTSSDKLQITSAEAADYAALFDTSIANATDIVQISNSGFAAVTDGVDGLAITFANGDGSNNTNSALRIAATSGGGAGDTLYGLRLDGITATGQTESAISIGANWDNYLDTATIDINGSGAITGATGISSTGTIAFGGLTTNGVVYTSGGNGTLNSEAQLALSRGGTNKNLTAVAGGIAYSDADSLEVTAAGNTGDCLVSQGSSAPAWGTCFAIDADSLDYDDFEDTMDLDANLTLNQTTFTWTQNFTGDTTTAYTLNADSLTTGTAIALSADALTTGKALDITSTAATLTSADLVNIASTGTYTTAQTVSGSLAEISRSLTINAAATTLSVTGPVSRISDNCTVTDGTCTSTANTLEVIQNYASNSGSALLVASAGNSSGFVFRANDDGTTTDSTPFVVTNNGNVGIGTNAPSDLLTVSGGSLTVTGTSGASRSITLLSGGATDLAQYQIGRASADGQLGVAGSSGQFSNIASQGDIVLRNNTEDLIFAARNASGNIYMTTGAADSAKLTVLSGGNVGVGDTSPDALFDIDSSSTSAPAFSITQSGSYTGTGSSSVVYVNSAATTGDIFNINGASLTTGSALVVAGHQSVGMTDSVVKLSGVMGNSGRAAGMLSLTTTIATSTLNHESAGLSNLVTNSPTGAANIAFGSYTSLGDATALANTVIGNYTVTTSTGNAAKALYGFMTDVTTTSTTADSLTGTQGTVSTATALADATNRTLIGARGLVNDTSVGNHASSVRGFYGVRGDVTSTTSTNGTTSGVGGYFAVSSANAADAGVAAAYGVLIDSGTSNTNGTSSRYGLYIASQSGADTNYQLYSVGTANSYFGGNIGIGATTPDKQLEIQGAHGTTQMHMHASVNGSTQDGHLYMWASEPGLTWDGVGISSNWRYTGGWARENSSFGGAYMRLASDFMSFNTVNTSGTDTRVMTLTGANVGIGDTTPDAPLDIEYGTTQTSGVARILASGNSSNPGFGLMVSNGYVTGSGSGSYEILGAYANTFGTSLLSVRDNGNVGIGTSTPSTIFHVAGSAGTVAGGTTLGGPLGVNGYAVNGCNGGGGAVWGLCVGGSSGGQSAWNNTSDVRLKENIVTIPDALEKLKALRGVYFDFKDLDGVYKTLPQDRQVGFIAQEVEAVLPEVVSTGADGMKMLATSSITALLTQAVQELNQKVENALLTINDQGYADKTFTAKKLSISTDANIAGTVIAGAFALDATKLNQVGTLASLPQSGSGTVSLADAINALNDAQQVQEDSIAMLQDGVIGVQDEIASQSAQLAAQTEKTTELEGELNTQKSALDEIRDQIAAQLGTTSAENDPVLTSPDELTATGSASLAQFNATTMSAKELTVSDTLTSLGETRLGNTILAGDFIQDGTLSITGGNEINVIGSGLEGINDGILYIQKAALARAVDFFNGLVTIDNTGSLKVPSVTVADFKVVAKKISGTATIKAGETSVVIDNPLVTNSARILVTPTSQNPAILAVTTKTEGESFTVSSAYPDQEDITFDWWMVQEVAQ